MESRRQRYRGRPAPWPRVPRWRPPCSHGLLGGAMTLLLVGIVAVILVILVAAFLTFRRGQDDDHDEAGGRWALRDRVRSAGRDGHGRGPTQELERAPRSERDEPSRRP